MVGCLLSVFTPQMCHTPEGVPYSCSIKDNLVRPVAWSRFVVAFNFLTAACFAALELVTFLREKYMILHMDVNLRLPEDNLVTELRSYPRLRTRLAAWNAAALNLSYCTAAAVVANFGLSAALIWIPPKGAGIHLGPAGKGAVAQIISNTLLIVSTLASYLSVSRSAAPECRAISMVTTVPLEHNCVDDVRCTARPPRPAPAPASAGGVA